MKTKNSHRILLLLIFFMTILACSLSGGNAIKDYGPASELYGDYWYHVKYPLTIESLRGRVVLVGVWRFT